MTAADELTLIERAKNHDESAFANLFNHHKQRVYSVCLRMTKNLADAEDFTQDVFLQVYRKIGQFGNDSQFSTWLHRIAVNTVLMGWRKKSLAVISFDEAIRLDDGEGDRRETLGARDPNLDQAVDRYVLERAIEQLPSGYRAILILHDIEGYEHHEIAEIIGCSVGNSKSQLHKARMRLVELLNPSASLEKILAALEP